MDSSGPSTGYDQGAQYQSAPGHAHFKALRRMLNFLWATYDCGIVYKRSSSPYRPGITVGAISTVLRTISVSAKISPGIGEHVAMSANGTGPIDSPLSVNTIEVQSSEFGAVESQ